MRKLSIDENRVLGTLLYSINPVTIQKYFDDQNDATLAIEVVDKLAEVCLKRMSTNAVCQK